MPSRTGHAMRSNHGDSKRDCQPRPDRCEGGRCSLCGRPVLSLTAVLLFRQRPRPAVTLDHLACRPRRFTGRPAYGVPLDRLHADGLGVWLDHLATKEWWSSTTRAALIDASVLIDQMMRNPGVVG